MSELDELTFEQALTRLEQIVEQLDAGDLPLEDALKLFEEGMALKTLCMDKLTGAEAVVEQYVDQEASSGEDAQ